MKADHFKVLAACVVATSAPLANAQTMVESIRTGWSTYIFVSTAMPERDVVSLAREALLSGATLVLRGFNTRAGEPIDLQGAQAWIGTIDRQCCDKQAPAWMVDPRVYERYRVRSVPAFVLANGAENGPNDYSLVSGDMELGNALKFFATTSSLPLVRVQAAKVYAKAFGGRQ